MNTLLERWSGTVLANPADLDDAKQIAKSHGAGDYDYEGPYGLGPLYTEIIVDRRGMVRTYSKGV